MHMNVFADLIANDIGFPPVAAALSQTLTIDVQATAKGLGHAVTGVGIGGAVAAAHSRCVANLALNLQACYRSHPCLDCHIPVTANAVCNSFEH